MNTDLLFEPIQIGDVKLKNRIAMSPMNVGYSGPGGYPSEQSLAYYATRARGGFGLLITECVVMNSKPWMGGESLNPGMFADQRYDRFWSELVELIHCYPKTKICLQLSPGWGRQGHPHVQTPEIAPAAPSAVPMKVDLRKMSRGWIGQAKRVLRAQLGQEMSGLLSTLNYEMLTNMSDAEYAQLEAMLEASMKAYKLEYAHVIFGDTPRELTIAEIEALEDGMALRASAAYNIGFDAIEIHSPHGYLIHQFLSPRSNKRADLYGGSIENRARFLTNIIHKIRAAVGPDRMLGCRLSGDDLMPGGITHDEVKQVVRLVTEAGVNFLDVSQGSYENPGAAFAPDGEDEFTCWAPGFKEASGGLPVITPNFMDPETALAAIESGKTDLISLGRQAIADPFWPAKVKAGRLQDLVKCNRCQQCYMNLFESRWISCSANPTMGREKYYPELWKAEGPLEEKQVSRFITKASHLPQI